MVLSNTCIGCVETPKFLQGVNFAVLVKILNKILNWQLTITQMEGMWELQFIAV